MATTRARTSAAQKAPLELLRRERVADRTAVRAVREPDARVERREQRLRLGHLESIAAARGRVTRRRGERVVRRRLDAGALAAAVQQRARGLLEQLAPDGIAASAAAPHEQR